MGEIQWLRECRFQRFLSENLNAQVSRIEVPSTRPVVVVEELERPAPLEYCTEETRTCSDNRILLCSHANAYSEERMTEYETLRSSP